MVVDDHFTWSWCSQQRGYTLLVAPTVNVQVRHVLIKAHSTDREDLYATGLFNGSTKFVGSLRAEPCFHACSGS